ncbi:MAG TPA: EamA family transporter [bacterium]|nr:EamA family transporter [bacterium]
MNWIFLALLTASLYGIYNFFIKIASGHINQIAGAVILQIVAALLGSVILIYLKLSNTQLEISSKGILFAILAGVGVGLAEITSFIVFSKNVPASIGIPIIIGGSVVISALLGLFFLKENYTPVHVIGLVSIVAGITLLSIK